MFKHSWQQCCVFKDAVFQPTPGSDGPAFHTQDADGRIDFDEFTAMMTAGNQELLSSQSTKRRAQLAEKVVSMRPTRNSLS